MIKKDYIQFVDSRMEREENKWRSFTYWAALYCWIKESRFDFDDLWIRDELECKIINDSWADMEWVQSLSDEAIAEILDISTLDERWRYLQDEVDREDKEEIFDELDMYTSFETRKEFEEKVKEIVSDNWNNNLDRENVAEQYEYEHFLSIKEEE